MKFPCLICFLLANVLYTCAAKAQTVDYKPVSIAKVSPFGLLASRLVGGYEKTINTKFSWQGGIGLIGGRRTIKSDTMSNNCAGFFLVPEIRYYFNKRAPTGFYASAFARLYYMREKQKDLVHSNNALEQDFSRNRITSSVGLGLMLGYQHVRKRFVIDISGGILNNRRSISTSYTDSRVNDFSFALNRAVVEPLDHDGMGMRFTFTIGYILNDQKNKDTKGFAYHNERVGIAQRY